MYSGRQATGSLFSSPSTCVSRQQFGLREPDFVEKDRSRSHPWPSNNFGQEHGSAISSAGASRFELWVVLVEDGAVKWDGPYSNLASPYFGTLLCKGLRTCSTTGSLPGSIRPLHMAALSPCALCQSSDRLGQRSVPTVIACCITVLHAMCVGSPFVGRVGHWVLGKTSTACVPRCPMRGVQHKSLIVQFAQAHS